MTWSFGEELKAYFGADIPALGEHVIPLPDGVSVDGRLVLFALHVTSGQALLDAVHARWQAIDADPGPDPFARTWNNRWRKEWEERVRPDMATIHLEAAFSNIEWSYEKQLLAI